VNVSVVQLEAATGANAAALQASLSFGRSFFNCALLRVEAFIHGVKVCKHSKRQENRIDMVMCNDLNALCECAMC
jgi:hypothetical protein